MEKEEEIPYPLKEEKAELFSPANIVMALLLGLLAWGGTQILSIRVALANHEIEQLNDNAVNVQVKELVPKVHALDMKLDGVICMLKHEPHHTELRMNCLHDTINKQ